jgi:hypothetical protein
MPPRPNPGADDLPGSGDLLHQWADLCLVLARTPADLYCGCRKIIRPYRATFRLDDSLTLAHAGYTSAKMKHLERLYLHQESIDVAVQLWNRRREQAKYGSVGFTCYNHFIKNDPNKKSKRASVMGPCLQSITLTWVDKQNVSIDAFYRTTEFLKKFPADLVFIRDRLLTFFNLADMDVSLTCHFANVTVHPMYFVTILPLLDDPFRRMDEIGQMDRRFYEWAVKWTARYVCPEYHRGIAKFSQALRVKAHADKHASIELRKYLRDNHPGYRSGYISDDAALQDLCEED